MAVKLLFRAFPLDAFKERCGEQAGKFTCAIWKDTFSGIPHLGVVDRWPATLKRFRFDALMAFL